MDPIAAVAAAKGKDPLNMAPLYLGLRGESTW